MTHITFTDINNKQITVPKSYTILHKDNPTEFYVEVYSSFYNITEETYEELVLKLTGTTDIIIPWDGEEIYPIGTKLQYNNVILQKVSDEGRGGAVCKECYFDKRDRCAPCEDGYFKKI